MNRILKGIVQLIGLIFIGVGVFGILKNWVETEVFSWAGLIFLILGAGSWGLSYALGLDEFFEHAADEEHEETPREDHE